MECPACHTSVADNQKFCPSCGAILPAAGSSDDPLVGTVIGNKYRVVSLLGEGGMGAVYLAEQQLGTKTRKVAIKTLHKDLSKNPQIQARFQREVGTVSELEHPNTIQVFDFGTTQEGPEGQLYIVMEFIQGKNVADIIEKDGAMPPARVENILRQVCGSLEEAHARGIVHRDLKPENIVLTERAGQKDFVKVLDFGIAKRSNEEDKNEQKLTQQGMVLGTPPYMSPEQFTGAPIDARSDIYSLGVMAYEMLTAQLPFKANTAWEWATQHMQAQPTPLEAQPNGAAIPANLRGAIMRSMAKAPADRFASVKDFADAFSNGAAAPMYNPESAPQPGKGKTQIGEPMDFSGLGAMGAMGAGAPGSAPMRVPTQAGNVTPAAGNHAFPTPPIGISAVPQGPQHRAPQKSKAPLIGALVVIGIGGIFGILAATGTFSHSSNSTVTASTGTTPTQTATASAAPTDTTAPTPPADSDTPLGDLPTGGGTAPHGGGTAPHGKPEGHDAGVKPGPEPKPPVTPVNPSPPVTPVTPPASQISDATRAACAFAKNFPNRPGAAGKRLTCITGGGAALL